MLKIISRHPGSGRIRASWLWVQRALFDDVKARSERRRHVDLSGEANLLASGAKAIHQGNGIWLLLGYAANGADIETSLAAMSKSWTDRLKESVRQSTATA